MLSAGRADSYETQQNPLLTVSPREMTDIIRKSRRAAPAARGGVIIEAAITLPILFLLAQGIYSCIGLINTYVALSQMVYEGAVAAVNVPCMGACATAVCTEGGLEACCKVESSQSGSGTSFETINTNFENCLNWTQTDYYKCGHYVAQGRLLRILQDGKIAVTGGSLVSQYQEVSLPTSSYDVDSFSFEASFTINDPLSFFNTRTIRLRAVSDYDRELACTAP